VSGEGAILSAKQVRALGDLVRDNVGTDDPYISIYPVDRNLYTTQSICIVSRTTCERRIWQIDTNGHTTQLT